MVLVVAPLMCIVCINPRASELLNHLGSTATDRTTNSDQILWIEGDQESIVFNFHGSLQVFQIAYWDFFFSPSLFDEWQMLCYAFVNEVKENIKPKTQLLLHLVECMHDSFAFCGERFESFNSRVRGYNIFGNRLAPSQDIARRFAALQHLHYICNDGTSESSARCGDGTKALLFSPSMQHIICGIPMHELHHHRTIYQAGALCKGRQSKCLLSELPLATIGSRTTLQQLQVSLEFIELVTPYDKSIDGQPVLNQYDCPILELSKMVFCTSSTNISRSVSLVHECTDSCGFKNIGQIANVRYSAVPIRCDRAENALSLKLAGATVNRPSSIYVEAGDFVTSPGCL
ncbi:hypothetical protein EMCRGX_G013875 [Ephydatia muelleri]